MAALPRRRTVPFHYGNPYIARKGAYTEQQKAEERQKAYAAQDDILGPGTAIWKLGIPMTGAVSFQGGRGYDGKSSFLLVDSQSEDLIFAITLNKDKNGTKTARLDRFYLRNAGARGRGLGTRTVANLIDRLAARGFTEIGLEAHRADEGKWKANGYYTWPRLGFDADIPDVYLDDLPPGLEDARRISDLMKTAQGREWWQKNGESLEMTMDLRRGSLGRRVLAAYIRERRNRPAPKSKSRTRKSLMTSGTQ